MPARQDAVGAEGVSELYAVRAPYVGLGLELSHNTLRHGLVDGKHHDGLATRRQPADMHRRDIDVRGAEHGSHMADQTWPVAVEGDEHRGRRRKIKMVPVDLHDMRLVVDRGAGKGVCGAEIGRSTRLNSSHANISYAV